MSEPTLAESQRLLWKLITAPEGVTAALAQLGASERAAAEALVCSDQRLSAVERLDIYANMYFFRLRDVLRDDFAAVHAVIGERSFHNLVTDYLLAHPPAHYSLRYAGLGLPQFLRGHALAQRWPYLSALAALEWALLESFDAMDGPMIEANALAAVPAGRWPDLLFEMSPSLRLLDLDWGVHETCIAAQRGDAPAEPAHTCTSVRVWRQNERVYQRPIDRVERAALAAVISGARFAEVCDQIAACAREPDSTERVLGLLQAWLGDGLISGFSLAG